MCYWFVFETVMYYVCVDVFVVCFQSLYFCNKIWKKKTPAMLALIVWSAELRWGKLIQQKQHWIINLTSRQ